MCTFALHGLICEVLFTRLVSDIFSDFRKAIDKTHCHCNEMGYAITNDDMRFKFLLLNFFVHSSILSATLSQCAIYKQLQALLVQYVDPTLGSI